MTTENRPEIDMTDVMANAKPLVVLVPSAEVSTRVAGLMPNVTGDNDFTKKANELTAQLAVPKPD